MGAGLMIEEFPAELSRPLREFTGEGFQESIDPDNAIIIYVQPVMHQKQQGIAVDVAEDVRIGDLISLPFGLDAEEPQIQVGGWDFPVATLLVHPLVPTPGIDVADYQAPYFARPPKVEPR